MWSLGCIFTELWHGSPLFRGKTAVEQLGAMFRSLGAPTEDVWPDVRALPNTATIDLSPVTPDPEHAMTRRMREAGCDSAHGMDVIGGLLTYDPRLRRTAAELLDHPYWKEAPLPLAEALMPTFAPTHSVIDATPRPTAGAKKNVRVDQKHPGGWQQEKRRRVRR